MLRAGIALAVFLALLFAVIALLVWVASTFTHVTTAALPIIVIVLVFGLVGRMIIRGFRGSTHAVGELINAAGRLEAGDYGVQVAERGPREVRALAHAFNSMSERLEATDAQRQRLLADVSHELRTPLTVIQGTIEGMLDGLYPADEAHLTPVLEEIRVLSRLVDDLRTLSSAEAGSLSLHREPTDLAALLDDVVAAFRSQAETAGVALAADVTAAIPTLELDPERIRQVLTNLVANALRYTPRGGRVMLTASQRDPGVEVRVSDTGSGISPEALSQVFERFYRTADSRGSGLGLPIARGLVVAHGGQIDATSELGGGTTIRFSLPAEPPGPAP